jgi:hypothetical protein
MTYIDQPRSQSGPNEPWEIKTNSLGRFVEGERIYNQMGLVVNYEVYWRQPGQPDTYIDESHFGKIVRAVRLAREMLQTTESLLREPYSDLLLKTLKYHFNVTKRDTGPIKIIFQRFATISDSFKRQLVICASATLRRGVRGATRPGVSMSISRRILIKNCDEAIARTLIHEGAHMYCNGIRSAFGELYCKDANYKTESNITTVDRADSYAWTALSLHSGRVLAAYNTVKSYTDPSTGNFSNKKGADKDTDEEGNYIHS